MGNEASAPETRYKREVLKLSWRLVLTVQEQAASEQASKDASRISAASQQTGITQDSKFLDQGQKVIRPFHEDFMTQFFKYCPDLKTQFPSNYTLVSKMIQSFVSNAVEAKDITSLSRKFAKGHTKYKLTDDHFQGFSGALVDTIQSRLGKFGTIELIKIWRMTTDAIVAAMHKEYLKAKKKK
mmetsp:Transcript_22367/g.31323  ORF Transcript_22367/g.31323 Transcript_22367/m.31323 type:complete len:183 (+) Transcript_22367:93-641(+)|eukprot:CAMPEP_0184479040 /NCGR_PEP_ID=MMETSP0113_2-20130426/907_1 /TAXON_ID=91329 /ORGANISM="Norrisiella sphaerica, Strain BC52" /LENGTH=182 /DNA_ID=CAMNT_0026857027 /DNA_START=144 /DNA_END=692 /DNA_ORIENTATION=+